MTNPARIFAWRGPPLALQITGLLLGALIVAQLVTLALTLFLPPEPPAKYGLADIAAAIRTAPDGGGLAREIRAAPPTVTGRGWLSSATSQADLAGLLRVAPERVTLAFYTPLPFAGTIGATASAPQPPRADPRPTQAAPIGFDPANTERGEQPVLRPAVLLVPGSHFSPGALLRLAQAGPGPGGTGGPPMGAPGGGFPGGGFPGGFPGGAMPPPSAPSGPPISPPPSAPTTTAPPTATAPASAPPAAPAPAQAPAGGQPAAPSQAPIASPAVALPPTSITTPAPGAPLTRQAPAIVNPRARVPTLSTTTTTAGTQATDTRSTRTEPESAASDRGTAVDPAPSPVALSPASPDARLTTTSPAPSSTAGSPIQRTGLQGAIDKARSLFGLAPAPFVEGDFVAAVALPDGRWVVVQPRAGWLTAWQKRVVLWFLIAFGITAPIGWLFARRLSRPLDRFADAAAQLGRDPSVAIAALDGPAEIGRAAHAFNLMQKRLRSFVDDRTAMVGAISHDLRTPLTRMRFRVEDAPDDIRGGMLQEVDDMEEMITSVLAFIRDASTPGVRERLDLKTLLDDVAEDVAVIGADVPVEAEGAATVEVEVLGMRRVLSNLVENALKYGEHARIRLTVSEDEAIAAVIDDGPGLPDEELEQVFQPFYRTASARASGAPGTGLGLAVCRSIARAHGGDVRLCRSTEGFRAEVRVPLVYEAMRALAA